MDELSEVCIDEVFIDHSISHHAKLSEINPGSLININHIEDNCGLNMIRLAEMGFTPSKPIKVIKNSGKGPMIIECRGIQLMIGRGLSRKIIVQVY